jgi:predicted O-methyltransferase YrrM
LGFQEVRRWPFSRGEVKRLTESGTLVGYEGYYMGAGIPDNLEANEAQKHMLRMGRKNSRKIQEKLREIALALGVPESRLPHPKTYSPRTK